MNPSYFSSKEISRAVVSVFNKVDLPAEQMKIIAIYLEQIICNKSSLVNWTVHLDDIDQDQLASLVLSVRNSLVCGLYKQLEKSGMVALNDSKELPELNNVASQETKENQLDSCNPIMADNVGSRSAGLKMLHKCDHCSYSSFNRNHVTQHERTHTGEKPIKCDLCAYSTTQNSFLRAHLRSHTGEKPFKCSLCPYAAGYSSNLKVHIRSHTGEKPHKCDKCSFASSYRYRLEKHKKSHDA
ncbi:zinc-finger double domain-containing protein [Ditylenchus destructor]|nr:zinc-finger double domain-containing protein [Ditylenchus destructor]